MRGFRSAPANNTRMCTLKKTRPHSHTTQVHPPATLSPTQRAIKKMESEGPRNTAQRTARGLCANLCFRSRGFFPPRLAVGCGQLGFRATRDTQTPPFRAINELWGWLIPNLTLVARKGASPNLCKFYRRLQGLDVPQRIPCWLHPTRPGLGLWCVARADTTGRE